MRTLLYWIVVLTVAIIIGFCSEVIARICGASEFTAGLVVGVVLSIIVFAANQAINIQMEE